MRWNALLMLLLGSVACGSTGSSPIDPSTDPAGWIYFSPNQAAFFEGPPSRVNVRTGEILDVNLPPPFNPDRAGVFFAGQVSPEDGRITGVASLGGPLPETFVYYPEGDSIEVIRDSWQGGFRVSLDARHTWSPDGNRIAIERHQVQFCACEVVIVVNPATGVTDTILPTPIANYAGEMFWFGSDTVVVYLNPPYRKFMAVSVTTGSRSAWDLVPRVGFLPPIVSPDRRWIANFDAIDSSFAGGNPIRTWRLQLLDRQAGTVRTLVADSTSGLIPLSATFDPDNRFIAYCTNGTTIAIRRLGHEDWKRRLTVPHCLALRWSWGPEGREADFAE